ncbi:MAG: Mbeg1-like protein [Eubacteriales bacterium]
MQDVSYDVSAALSALMYDISGQSGLVNLTLDEILTAQVDLRDSGATCYEHLDELLTIVEANHLGDVVVLDCSWSYGDTYGTMNATTFSFPDGESYVAYRGTGAGNWEYNAESAYGYGSSDMQDWALEYFNNTIENNNLADSDIYVAGHSQGGNNAMYVTLYSEYGENIVECVSIDGPGFNETVAAEAQSLDNFDAQLNKIYGVYGENDYVHVLGEVQLTDPDHTLTVATPTADDVASYHDIFSHFSEDGVLCEEAETGAVTTYAEYIVKYVNALDKDDRYQFALTVMGLIEGFIGDKTWDLDVNSFSDFMQVVTGIGAVLAATAEYVIIAIHDAVVSAINSIQAFIHSLSAGVKYAANNPYFKVDTAKLESYATRIIMVNARLNDLDDDMRSLYWQVGFSDLWDILTANLIVGGSPTLNKIKNYLNDAADDFALAEQKANQYMSG